MSSLTELFRPLGPEEAWSVSVLDTFSRVPRAGAGPPGASEVDIVTAISLWRASRGSPYLINHK